MSDTTKIEWASATWNPWEGCTKVSPGCANCYAAARNHRFGMDNWGPGKPRRRTSAANWKKPRAWNKANRPEATNHRPRIFPSLCDWLDAEVPVELLADFLKLIRDTPNLDWLLLTKRPENWASRIEGVLRWIEGQHDWGTLGQHRSEALRDWLADWFVLRKAPANIWLGTSVEDQTRADERIPELLRIPASVRFLSVEPMLGAVDLKTSLGERELMSFSAFNSSGHVAGGIGWVIVGGESGPGARPCHVDWIRGIVGQCRAAGVPCFVKQLGAVVNGALAGDHGTGWMPVKFKHPKGGDPTEWPEDLRSMREFPQT